ncbi:MAG TPA: RNA-binding S4 domain-containing protein [Sphingobacteriaceae bacterium]|nr:RNA-binding S4 domain-containing protein [Sphingobacteriaceae bacterium]
MTPRPIAVERLPIKLSAFLKLAGVVGTGGEAGLLVAEGAVLVNGTPEYRRGRGLQAGDVVTVADRGRWLVVPAG